MTSRALTPLERAVDLSWRRKRPEYIDPLTAAALAGLSVKALQNRRIMGRINPQTFEYPAVAREKGSMIVVIYSKRQIAMWVASGLKAWPPRMDDEILMRNIEATDYLRRATGRALSDKHVRKAVKRGLLRRWGFGRPRYEPTGLYILYSRYDLKQYIIRFLLPRRYWIDRLPVWQGVDLTPEEVRESLHIERELDIADRLNRVDPGLAL